MNGVIAIIQLVVVVNLNADRWYVINVILDFIHLMAWILYFRISVVDIEKGVEMLDATIILSQMLCRLDAFGSE